MEIVKRIKAPTPDFFKKIMWVAGILIVVAGALIAGAEQLELPAVVSKVCWYIVIVGTAVLGTAQTAKK